ncbi:hypothetical protein C8F04DRAFT_1401629 [Mycena alexandri]|uniref:F-box domain-containing protein n=1 Tax=Mycena alexandri TaxID=1745969 RepID=A0AAD6SAA3_9AGAR|nr:hypothetical protein C8F04DRAFT_1401629 [Mycena alexandri]
MLEAFDLGEMHHLLPSLQRQNLDSLSDEVLRRIFDYIQSSAEYSHPQLLLASVTHHWRELAIGIPSLWTTIRINHDRQISALGEILLRSKNLPVAIYIRLDAFRYRFFTEYLDAIDALVPHIARWRSLSIIATNPVLHNIRNRIQNQPMLALEHFELVQSDSGRIQHLGPFIFEPSVFRSLRLERTMMYAADASLLAGLTHIELVQSSLAMLDEHKLLSLEYPTHEPRPPSMLALQHLVLDASNPVHESDGLPYSPAFTSNNLASVSFAHLAAPSMDLVQALSRVYGTALSAPHLRCVSIADIAGHALVMLLSVVRSLAFPLLDRLELAGIDTAGIDDRVMCAFTKGVRELVLARLDAGPILGRLVDPTVLPVLERIELDGVEIFRPST